MNLTHATLAANLIDLVSTYAAQRSLPSAGVTILTQLPARQALELSLAFSSVLGCMVRVTGTERGVSTFSLSGRLQ